MDTKKKEYTLNVEGKSLGRAASEAAAILRGKNSPSFAPNKAPNIKLVITGVNGLKLTGKKAGQKTYKRTSGYPGGLKISKFQHVLDKKGMAFIFRETIEGMLKRNRLRAVMMKNLEIK